MDVRLAQNGSDYFVPFALGKGKTATVKILGLKKDALALSLLKLSDTFDTANTDYYRPSYHFTPLYGWMNDPNARPTPRPPRRPWPRPPMPVRRSSC